jgi:hypothetical protein
MKICLLLLYLMLFAFSPLFSQNLFKKATKSVFALYGHHLPTNYEVETGQNNLIGRKHVFSAEAGLNLDYPLNEKWMIRTGVSGHLLFLNEVTYGISGPIPPGVNDRLIGIYGRGIEYIESVSIGLPIKALYNFPTTGKYNFSVSGGPYVAVYFPANDEMAGMQAIKNGELIRQHWVTRHFKNYKTNQSLCISYPQLEWDFDVQATRKFKRYGAASLGIKAHIGTRSLERATFVIWPDEPEYRSKGNFILNRSYIGIFSAFRFGRN